MTNPNHTPEEIANVITYNPTTGDLMWKERDVSFFNSQGQCRTWNTQYANRRAGSAEHNTVRYGNRNYKGYTLAWVLYYGEWPERSVKQRDGNILNNKIDNLYVPEGEVDRTPQETDHPDIKYHPDRQLFRAVYKDKITLGYFKSYEKAEQAWILQDECYV